MDVAKIGQVLDNLKMDPNEHVDSFAAKWLSKWQFKEKVAWCSLGWS